MVRASVTQGQIIVPVSARSEQDVQDSNIKNSGSTDESTAEGSECCANQGKDEKEVDDDDWDEDWDTFQSLPATAANDAVDSGENSPANSHHKQFHQENASQGISDGDITAGAIEGRASSEELEEPCDFQCSSTEQHVNKEFLGSSHEDCVEHERRPTVDCKEPLAHIEMADELQQVNEDTDQASQDLKDVSTEIHRIEVDAHGGSISSTDEFTRNSNNLSE